MRDGKMLQYSYSNKFVISEYKYYIYYYTFIVILNPEPNVYHTYYNC